jgi:sigma-B regulation protein RsbU (phosphoserine phosphatase)
MTTTARASRFAAPALPEWVGRMTWIPESAVRAGTGGTSGPTPVLKQLPMLLLFALALCRRSRSPRRSRS